jgi:hypothetical protein
VTDIILSSGGLWTSTRDAIVAFWNAPLDQPDHALGLPVALVCQKRLAELQTHFLEKYGRAWPCASG